MDINRRTFLKAGLSSLAYFSAESTTPNWIIRAAHALPSSCLDNDRVLVIVQLSGGNDGLNTVIPRTDPIYYDAQTRPTIRVPSGREINLDGLNGLHPSLLNLANWYQKGRLAVVNNVGYVNPNLSHFSSMDHFEYGTVPGDGIQTRGWVARFYDNKCSGAGEEESLFMTAAGMSSVPNTFEGAAGYTPPAVSNPAFYIFATASDRSLRLGALHDLNQLTGTDPELDFVRRSANTAEASVNDMAVAAAQPDLVPATSYSNNSLGRGLRLASQVIRAGFRTRIFYVSQGGYDTHASQAVEGDPVNGGDHPRLLGALDNSLNAFLSEMELSGNLHRVLVMTFSEFGRRIKENGSQGTDHGAASCMFLLGGLVQPGVYGGQPDLANTIKGNLKHSIDFRSVYAQVIESWFGGQAAPVFGQTAYDTIIRPELDRLKFVLPRSTSADQSWRHYE